MRFEPISDEQLIESLRQDILEQADQIGEVSAELERAKTEAEQLRGLLVMSTNECKQEGCPHCAYLGLHLSTLDAPRFTQDDTIVENWRYMSGELTKAEQQLTASQAVIRAARRIAAFPKPWWEEVAAHKALRVALAVLDGKKVK